MGNNKEVVFVLAVVFQLCPFLQIGMAQLRQNYYANICPDIENIVRNSVTYKFNQTFVTAPTTLRLFFHDCFVQGCDASIMVASYGKNKTKTEKDHPDNLSLAGDGFDTVIQAKAAVDAVPQCKNKVSCADILALAARDVIVLTGGPNYGVELGRLDGLSSTASSVDGKLPQPNFNLNKLTSMFASHGLSRTDMIALSAAHSLGFSHCSRFSNRIYNFTPPHYTVDPTITKPYVEQLRGWCPENVDPRVAVNMDPITPKTFDNQYFKNLQRGMGLLTSDQVLYTDTRSRSTVNCMAKDSNVFEKAFVSAMRKLGRIGVKMGKNGNIRHNCGSFN